MPDLSDVLKGLSLEQEVACTDPGNILLTACPGSGKTPNTDSQAGISGVSKTIFSKVKYSNNIYE